MQKTEQIKWLNCAKAVAIIAVLIDHTTGILYSSQTIATASYFSVSLFILIAGMTSYLSDSRHAESCCLNFVRSTRKIIEAYIIAAGVFTILSSKGFDLLKYLSHLIHFDASLPHYFVLLYVQLMVVNRFLFNLLQTIDKKKNTALFELLLLLAITGFSVFTTNYTNILDVYGGGGKLFGGTYLILYYIGMLIAKHRWLNRTTARKSGALLVLGGAGFFAWLTTIIHYGQPSIDANLPFGEGFNPPGICFSVLALTMMIFCFGLFSLMESFSFMQVAVNSLNWIGKNTLCIFLYHELFLIASMRFGIDTLMEHNAWAARILCYGVMLFGPILLNAVIDRFVTFVKNCCRSGYELQA